MIHKQFISRDGNATILPPLHCHRQKSIARVSVALYTGVWRTSFLCWRFISWRLGEVKSPPYSAHTGKEKTYETDSWYKTSV
jgi:hypothetical protein